MPSAESPDEPQERQEPLAGYVVLDFTQILAGPFCTQLLSDAGATVIKIEPPGGEFSRIRGPKRTGPDGHQLSAYSAAVNHGKQCVALDLKTPAGLSLARALVAQADVVVENFLPGTMDRLGLGLADLRAQRPELVTCSISLFGDPERAGDLATRGGLSMVAESESTIIGMQRREDGSPIELGFALGDMSAAMAGYSAIVTALLGRERHGAGRHLDISMVGVLLALNAPTICGEEIIRGQVAEAHEQMRNTAGMGLFATQEGYVAVGVNNDRLFVRLARAIGQEELAVDPRYAHYTERDQRADEVNRIVSEWSSQRSTAEVIDALARENVPHGLVASPGDVLDSPTIERLGLLTTIDDGLGGSIRVPANPYGFSQPSPAVARLGENNRAVLAARLGLSDDEYDDLRHAGAFGAV